MADSLNPEPSKGMRLVMRVEAENWNGALQDGDMNSSEILNARGCLLDYIASLESDLEGVRAYWKRIAEVGAEREAMLLDETQALRARCEKLERELAKKPLAATLRPQSEQKAKGYRTAPESGRTPPCTAYNSDPEVDT